MHTRLKEELARLELSAAEAARIAELQDSQGLRDVLGGRKRLSAELLAVLAARCGIDAMYVLLGQRAGAGGATLAPDEEILLDNYRDSPPDAQAAIKASSTAFAASKSKRQRAA